MVSVVINPVSGLSVKFVSGWKQINDEIGSVFLDVASLHFYDDSERVVYDFYVDDLGYYKKEYEPAVLSGNYPALLGTCVIMKHSDNGDVSLDVFDIKKIVSHMLIYNPDPDNDEKVFYVLRGTMR